MQRVCATLSSRDDSDVNWISDFRPISERHPSWQSATFNTELFDTQRRMRVFPDNLTERDGDG